MRKLFLVICVFVCLGEAKAQYTMENLLDLNNQETSIFKTGWQPANRPSGCNYGAGLSFKYLDERYSGQILLPCIPANPELYFRINTATVWGDWIKVWHSGNVNELKVVDLNLEDYWKKENNSLSYLKNVGIGTNTPHAQLEVQKSADISSAWSPNLILNNGWGGIGSEGIRIRSALEGMNFDIFSYDHVTVGDTYLGFRVGQGNIGDIFKPSNAQMVLTDDGFVGIGTQSPDYLLDVNGTIRAKEIKVNLNDGPDFVFEDDYDLKSLDEVDQFIKERKHLPGVPSAKQMEKDGVGLAEMNKLLLQKVEELTLHTIEQEKKIQNQEDELSSKSEQIEELKEEFSLLRQQVNELIDSKAKK
ncbi:hypothetical protein EYV94_27600 [Puteibacter caeruleilacunae]|nr:hypothetical protein EYV94_27600 [Puteibacter caeruleilacunae]